MSYSLFIFEQASVPKDTIPYVIVGQGAINVLATIVAVSNSFLTVSNKHKNIKRIFDECSCFICCIKQVGEKR